MLPAKIRFWLPRLLMVLFGIIMAFVTIEAFFRLFPQYRPDSRTRLLDMGTIQFKMGQGDMFVHRAGLVAPPANPDEILSEYHLAFDADGFRVPAKPSAAYDVIAIGDSYTEGAHVALPWPDTLAEKSGLRVRNMGFRGYGPVEELKVLREYAAKSEAKLIIIGYFEGNDLYDVISVRWREPFVLPSIARKVFEPDDPNAQLWKTDSKGPFPLPVQIDLGGTIYDAAFLDGYLSWVNGEKESFLQSDNIAALRQVWKDMKQATDTCLAIAYLPTGPHIYAPYLVPEDRTSFMSTVTELSIKKPGGGLDGINPGGSFEEAMKRLDFHRDAIAQVADELGFVFIDVVPAFKQAAARGEFLYFTYDTHMNQAGQTLAGATIAEYLAQHPDPCSKQK